jgi:hypothetical protein
MHWLVPLTYKSCNTRREVGIMWTVAPYIRGEGCLKSSWTGGSAPLLCKRRYNNKIAAHCSQSTSFSNCPRNYLIYNSARLHHKSPRERPILCVTKVLITSVKIKRIFFLQDERVPLAASRWVHAIAGSYKSCRTEAPQS